MIMTKKSRLSYKAADGGPRPLKSTSVASTRLGAARARPECLFVWRWPASLPVVRQNLRGRMRHQLSNFVPASPDRSIGHPPCATARAP